MPPFFLGKLFVRFGYFAYCKKETVKILCVLYRILVARNKTV